METSMGPIIANFCLRRISDYKQRWIRAFSITTTKIWINPTYLKALSYALRELRIKVNDNNKNVKYEKKILCFSMHRNTKESK
jgi:hypothetical protein